MEWIDLGLPSGNLWAAENEEGYYTFDEAVSKFGDSLPTEEDIAELLSHCWKRWDGKRKGMEFMGNNGEKLFLPASGGSNGRNTCDVGNYGYYWSATQKSPASAMSLDFHFSGDGIFYGNRNYKQSVRIVLRGGGK